jgi:hypothetical protein
VKITEIRLERLAGTLRARATVEWEGAGRPAREIFFETESDLEEDFSAAPEAFATACVLPAMRHGEERLLVEGFLCPRLAEGLEIAAALVQSWYGPPRRAVRIEASRGFHAPVVREPSRAALALTGGIDSLHLLRRNRLDFSLNHAESFRDALVVCGLLSPGAAVSARSRDGDRRTRLALSAVAFDAGITLVPVTTNLRDLETDVAFLEDEWIGAALASSAHLFAKRWSSFSLASGRDAERLLPRGTHPLLDPLFGSAALEIRHVGIRFGRLERVGEIASWDAGVENIVVCLQRPEPPLLNCGRCEKCVRTMTELLAIGALGRAVSFPSSDVTPQMIRGLRLSALVEDYWKDVLPLLAERGRGDLGSEIRAKLRRARWKGRLKKADRRVAGGRLAGAWRSWRGGPESIPRTFAG